MTPSGDFFRYEPIISLPKAGAPMSAANKQVDRLFADDLGEGL